MSDTNFQPIFDYLDERITSLETGLRADMATKSDINRVLTAIDGLAKRTNDTDAKTTLLENKAERIEHWVIKAAEKTEIPYKP